MTRACYCLLLGPFSGKFDKHATHEMPWIHSHFILFSLIYGKTVFCLSSYTYIILNITLHKLISQCMHPTTHKFLVSELSVVMARCPAALISRLG